MDPVAPRSAPIPASSESNVVPVAINADPFENAAEDVKKRVEQEGVSWGQAFQAYVAEKDIPAENQAELAIGIGAELASQGDFQGALEVMAAGGISKEEAKGILLEGANAYVQAQLDAGVPPEEIASNLAVMIQEQGVSAEDTANILNSLFAEGTQHTEDIAVQTAKILINDSNIDIEYRTSLTDELSSELHAAVVKHVETGGNSASSASSTSGASSTSTTASERTPEEIENIAKQVNNLIAAGQSPETVLENMLQIYNIEPKSEEAIAFAKEVGVAIVNQPHASAKNAIDLMVAAGVDKEEALQIVADTVESRADEFLNLGYTPEQLAESMAIKLKGMSGEDTAFILNQLHASGDPDKMAIAEQAASAFLATSSGNDTSEQQSFLNSISYDLADAIGQVNNPLRSHSGEQPAVIKEIAQEVISFMDDSDTTDKEKSEAWDNLLKSRGIEPGSDEAIALAKDVGAAMVQQTGVPVQKAIDFMIIAGVDENDALQVTAYALRSSVEELSSQGYTAEQIATAMEGKLEGTSDEDKKIVLTELLNSKDQKTQEVARLSADNLGVILDG